MYQIDVPSAAASLPTPAAAGTAGYFTDGDPVAGSPGTIVPADFLNMVMVELLGVVTAGGLVPSKTDRGQLLKAIKALASGNLTASGHISLPIGTATFILNWGGGAHGDGTGAAPVTFDQAFGTGVLFSIAGNNASGPPAAFHGTGAHTKTGMTVYSSSSSGVAAGAGTAFRWLALGV